MCKVSDKFKLCTCAASSVSVLKHYWIFYRFDKTKDNLIMGIFALPDMINENTTIYNKALLLERLNEPDVFDVNLYPKSRDRLQITFSCVESIRKEITYGYSYKKGKWVEEEYDPLEWQWHHNEERFGKIKSAITRRERNPSKFINPNEDKP